jgi:hypothetical protein
MEAQSLFFPWHIHTPQTWRNVDLSPPWHLHRNAMDMLDSGDAYRPLYQASLAFDRADFLPTTGTPQFLTLASDVLRSHAARPALAQFPVTLFEEPAALWKAVAAALAGNPGDPAPAFATSGLFHRGTLVGTKKPLVLLHPAGASSRFFAAALSKLAGPVLAFDLPGHGFDESVSPPMAEGVAALVGEECRALGFDSYVVAGQRFGGVIAKAMARPGVTSLDIGARSTTPDLAAKGAVSLAPEWDGGHLLRAWRAAWRQAIWDPWYDNTAAAAREQKGDLSPTAIHDAALDLLRAGPAWLTANAIEASAEVAAQKTIPPDRPDLWPSILSPLR